MAEQVQGRPAPGGGNGGARKLPSGKGLDLPGCNDVPAPRHIEMNRNAR